MSSASFDFTLFYFFRFLFTICEMVVFSFVYRDRIPQRPSSFHITLHVCQPGLVRGEAGQESCLSIFGDFFSLERKTALLWMWKEGSLLLCSFLFDSSFLSALQTNMMKKGLVGQRKGGN